MPFFRLRNADFFENFKTVERTASPSSLLEEAMKPLNCLKNIATTKNFSSYVPGSYRKFKNQVNAGVERSEIAATGGRGAV